MAGDWLKVEIITPDKEEISLLSELLSIEQDAAFGKCFRVWAWADQHSLNGNAVRVTTSFLDRLAGLPGFAEALRKVGWLEGREGSLSFPHFDRHNGQTAKSRALTKKRVEVHRQANGNAAGVTSPLPEKRREEWGEIEKRACELPECLPPTEEAARKSIPVAGIPPDSLAAYWLDIASRGGRDGAGHAVTNWAIYAKKRWGKEKSGEFEKAHRNGAAKPARRDANI